jgi:hypothetical protein
VILQVVVTGACLSHYGQTTTSYAAVRLLLAYNTINYANKSLRTAQNELTDRLIGDRSVRNMCPGASIAVHRHLDTFTCNALKGNRVN